MSCHVHCAMCILSININISSSTVVNSKNNFVFQLISQMINTARAEIIMEFIIILQFVWRVELHAIWSFRFHLMHTQHTLQYGLLTFFLISYFSYWGIANCAAFAFAFLNCSVIWIVITNTQSQTRSSTTHLYNSTLNRIEWKTKNSVLTVNVQPPRNLKRSNHNKKLHW